MALQMSFDLNGVLVATSYRRVENLSLSRANKTVAVEVATYADAAHKNVQPIDVRTVVLRNAPKVMAPDGTVITPKITDYDDYLAGAATGKDPYALAYNSIKTLPEFTGAIDV